MPDPLTPAERERLRELHAATSPGPWRVMGYLDLSGTYLSDATGAEVADRDSDRAFIIAAHAALPCLLDALDAADRTREERNRLWGEIAETIRRAEEAEAAAGAFHDPEELARRFHEAYERLAPSFGYKTREDSAKPWNEVPEQNKQLMIAVCRELAPDAGRAFLDRLRQAETERDRLRKADLDAGPMVEAIIAQRDRYRAALSRIAMPAGEGPVRPKHTAAQMVRFARDALWGGEGKP